MRYRAALVAWEDDPQGGRWIAPMPDGPIGRLEGIGPLLLDVLAEAGEPLDAAELTRRLRTYVPDAPDDAEQIVEEFLPLMARLGVVTAEEQKGGAA
ncbi:hypothetical protein JSY14_06075 [Brachybacterium sp. EF45031]|uniref:hypothetical protein n=1 Tax=Brachybacterium sillae TaxID=2810536 RepID=UPI00217DAD2A|nr:hypothetical protein [Brachybacterium sillae]MCS6711614.1 hypothetical protein [Brachybacterium sillae]